MFVMNVPTRCREHVFLSHFSSFMLIIRASSRRLLHTHRTHFFTYNYLSANIFIYTQKRQTNCCLKPWIFAVVVVFVVVVVVVPFQIRFLVSSQCGRTLCILSSIVCAEAGVSCMSPVLNKMSWNESGCMHTQIYTWARRGDMWWKSSSLPFWFQIIISVTFFNADIWRAT